MSSQPSLLTSATATPEDQPSLSSMPAGFVGLLKCQIPQVEVDFIIDQVACEKQVRQTIIIEVPDAYATTAIIIAVHQNIMFFFIGDGILKMYIGLVWRKQMKKLFGFGQSSAVEIKGVKNSCILSSFFLILDLCYVTFTKL
jgi:hypothetical protein